MLLTGIHHQSRFVALGLCVAIAALPGCLPVHTYTRTADTPLRQETKESVVPGERQLAERHVVRDTDLSVDLRTERECETVIIPVVRRVEYTTRTAAQHVNVEEGEWKFWMWVIAGSVTLTVFGGPVAKDWRVSAWGSVPLVGYLLINGVRVIDTTSDRGEVRLSPIVRREPCRAEPVAGRPATLTLGSLNLTERTSAAGNVRYSMAGLTLADLSSSRVDARVTVPDGLGVGLLLERSEVAALHDALVARPGTRYAIELALNRERECANQVAQASDATRDVDRDGATAPAALATWERAREGCGVAWSAGREEERVRARVHLTAIVDARAREARALNSAREALGAVRGGDPGGARRRLGGDAAALRAFRELDGGRAVSEAVAALLERLAPGGDDPVTRAQLCQGAALAREVLGDGPWQAFAREAVKRTGAGDALRTSRAARLLAGEACR